MDTNISADGGRVSAVQKNRLEEDSFLLAQATAATDTFFSGVAAMAYSDIVPVIEAVLDDRGLIQGVVENGGITNDNTPTLIGKALPGVKVHVYRGKYLQSYVTADENGDWSYTPGPWASGRHELSIKYEYPNKDTSGYSAPYVIFVDSISPRAPVVGSVEDGMPGGSGLLLNGGYTSDSRPTIKGTAEGDATIIIYDGEKEIGRAQAGSDGNWSFTPEAALGHGRHDLAFAALDAAGNLGEKSEQFVINVDSVGPVIGAVLDDRGLIQGVVENGGTTNDNTPTLIGKALPGVKVHLYRGKYLQSYVTADENGDWSYTPGPWGSGRHELSVKYEYPNKATSGYSAPYVIFVDTIIPKEPVVGGVIDDVGRITGFIGSEGITDDNRPTVVGTAEANATVIVYDKGKEIGRAAVDDQGNWSFTPAAALKDGTHILTCWVMDRAGNMSEFLSPPFEFEVDARADRIRIYSADDNVGADVGTLLSGDTTDDRTPTLSGTANADGIVRIYEGGKLLGQVVADEFGDWEFTPDVAWVYTSSRRR